MWFTCNIHIIICSNTCHLHVIYMLVTCLKFNFNLHVKYIYKIVELIYMLFTFYLHVGYMCVTCCLHVGYMSNTCNLNYLI